MIGPDVILFGVGTLAGAGVGYALGRIHGAHAERTLTAPPPSADVLEQLPPLVVQYAIIRNGVRVWYGTDATQAKTWWEHQKRSPGARALLFTQDGVLRDHFHVSG